MRKTLDIVKKQLDITTADEKIAAGQMSDSEKMIAADMRRYLNNMQKQFEVVEEMKKRDNRVEDNIIIEVKKKETILSHIINIIKKFIYLFG